MSNNVVVKKIGSQNDIIMLSIRGSLDSIVAYSLQDQVETLIQEGHHKYLIDLADLEHISSAGVGLFSAAILDLKRRQGKIIFVNIPDQVYHILRITRLVEIFTLAKTQEKAVEQLELE